MSKGHTLEPDTKTPTPPLEFQADTLMLMMGLYLIFIGAIVGWNVVKLVKRYKAYKNMSKEQQDEMRQTVARLNNQAIVKANAQDPCPPHIWLDKGNQVLGDHYLACGKCGRKPNES